MNDTNKILIIQIEQWLRTTTANKSVRDYLRDAIPRLKAEKKPRKEWEKNLTDRKGTVDE